MKKFLNLGIFFAFFCSSAIWAASTAKIGVIDVQKVLASSKLLVDANSNIEKSTKKQRDVYQGTAQKCKDLETNYKKNRVTLSDADKKKQEDAIDQCHQTFDKNAKDYQQSLLAARAKFLDEKKLENFQGSLKDAIAKAAAKSGVNVVIPMGVAVYTGSDVTDLTSAVAKILN